MRRRRRPRHPSTGLASPSPTTPFVPAPAPALWADDGCAVCHGEDGSGGGGPDIRCTSYAALDSYVRAVNTPHVGGAYPSLTDENLLALEAFLRAPDCPGTVPGQPTPPPSGGLPADHTENEDGVFHHPDYESNLSTCTTCHGPDLEGTSVAPACVSCHGTGGFDDDAFDDDDDEADDDHEADEVDDDEEDEESSDDD